MLSLVNITKEFPGVKALDGVNLSFYPGKVNALLGENGAGKSTLLKIISGEYLSYSGEIIINNNRVNFTDIKSAQKSGICIIHQELNLIPSLSIRENIFLGKEIVNSWGVLQVDEMQKKAIKILNEVGLYMSPNTLIEQLKVSEQQLIEIAKALYSDASIILMDEPTSALDGTEVKNLHRLIRQWKEAGKTIVYISHKMDELFAIADTYSVLRDGKSVHAGNMQEVSMDELVGFMVGRSIQINKKENSYTQSELALLVPSLSLQLFKGEVVGIYGLMGAGRTELLESLFGLGLNHSTQIQLFGKDVNISSPKQAIENHMAFVTEDRKSEGLVMQESILFNYSLPQLQFKGMLHDEASSKSIGFYREQLCIKSTSVHQVCGELSGGNQQKVILAKWLGTSPKILLMDEPTRGIDIKAKDEMYGLMQKMAKEGMAILFASSEIPEIIAMSDRVLVMSEGKISKELIGDSINENELLYAALPTKRF